MRDDVIAQVQEDAAKLRETFYARATGHCAWCGYLGRHDPGSMCGPIIGLLDAILAASRAEETSAPPTVRQTGAPLEEITTIDVSQMPPAYVDAKACCSCLRLVSEPHADNCTWYRGYQAGQRCAS